MNLTKKVWIAGAMISAMMFGGLVAATTETPLVTLGNGCCRTSVSPLEPLPIDPVPVDVPPTP